MRVKEQERSLIAGISKDHPPNALLHSNCLPEHETIQAYMTVE